MKLKKSIYIAAVASASFMIQSCESFTDIDQKGMNLLGKTSDLDLLLNQTVVNDYTDFGTMSGDIIDGMNIGYLPEALDNTVKNYITILTAWDENDHASRLPLLTESDGFYEKCYTRIGRIANPILMRVDDAQGSDSEKNMLKAEAYTVRAYYHYLAAQKYARAYNPATAETEPCIPYLTDDWDIQVPTSQLTQKEVYTNIIADLDKAIKLNSLPEIASTRTRMCAAAPYAIKAHVLLTLRDIDGAAEAAAEALKHGNEITDYGNMLTEDYSWGGVLVKKLRLAPKLQLNEDYFTDVAQNASKLITPFCESMFEEGSYRKLYYPTLGMLMKGFFVPDDLEADQMAINAHFEQSYGVPYSISDESYGYNSIGVKTTHMYLILAECAIEKGNFDEAMGYLDTIRKNRIAAEYYHDLKGTVSSKDEAIKCLKKACHGEYAFTVWNFFSRKRWTVLEDYKETFVRELCGKTYRLTPESDLWVFPFPITVLAQNHNLKNNYQTNI